MKESFGKIFPWLKQHYRHLICASFVSVSLILTFTRYRDALMRIGEAAIDLWHSIVIYFFFLIDVETSTEPTVLQLQDLQIDKYLPFDVDELIRKLELLPSAFVNPDHLSDYLYVTLQHATVFLNSLVLLIPIVLILWNMVKSRITEPNNDYNQDSKALAIYKKTVFRWLCAVRDWCADFFAFLVDNGLWWKLAAVVWVVNLNLVGIVLGALAFYFYFAASIDFVSLFGTQLLKLLIDLILTFCALPFLFWVFASYLLFRWICKNIGYKVLEYHEQENRKFLSSLPLVIFLNGTMGSKKTTTITDMAISYEIMFRDKALELILELDLMFPHFPWIMLEREICDGMKKKRIYNLASCRKYMERLERKYHKAPTASALFDYDITNYPTTYNNDLEIVDIWQALTDYACLYFIYTIQSSLLVSNYSVRVDNVMNHAGNFPLWDTELFRRDPRMMDAISRHAHILDFDVLRISRQVVEDNKNTGSFEFGVALITEIDKERGNRIKLEGVKSFFNETNQKNDNFNYSFKMGRHPATVRNYPFIRFLLDAQRPESWEADGRQLSTELFVRECSKVQIAMPGFVFFEMFYEWVYSRFSEYYPEYRYNCGDNKLTVRWLHTFSSLVIGHYNRIRNRFGYMESTMELRDGSRENDVKTHPYYLSTVKIYSRRFATDSHRSFFADRAIKSKRGINDYPVYKTVRATLDELHQQNSYFITEMEGLNESEDDI